MERNNNYNRGGNSGGYRGGGRSNGGRGGGGRGGGYHHGGRNGNYSQQYGNQQQEYYGGGGGRGRGRDRDSGGRGQQSQRNPANSRQHADRVPELNAWSRVASGQPVVAQTQTLTPNRNGMTDVTNNLTVCFYIVA
ncbi:hypothetical protein Hanom_Chr16g01507841 [Helianthus anomalus]